MKLKKIAAATMWLPGFEPKFLVDQPALADVVPFPLVCSAPASPAPSLQCWPELNSNLFNALSGVVSKYNANVAAIELLRSIEADGRLPSKEERDILNLYTGWGGIPQAFNPDQKDEAWAARSVSLRGFLTEAEWQSAHASTNNAHFTSLEVVQAVWAGVSRLGFKGGRVLEPSAGVGYFLGGMPSEIANASDVTAFELDDISARILKALYGNKADVRQGAFETNDLPSGFFDLAISNIPFGNYGVAEHRNVPYSKFLIHDYFFARALDMVRPSGLVAFITSAGTMDKTSSEVRAYLAGKADLLAAIRLPSVAFKRIANTEVTTDLLILQKRAEGATSANGLAWLNSTTLPTSSPAHGEPATYRAHSFVVNEYFHRAPENIIGKMVLSGGAYRDQLSCNYAGDLVAALNERVAALPENRYAPRTPLLAKAPAIARSEGPEGFVLIDGVLHENIGAYSRPVEGAAKKIERIIGMIQVRDAARQLISAQPATEDDELLARYRLALNVAYDGFISRFGALSDRANRLAFRTDPAAPLLLSLEEAHEESGEVTKGAIFSRRTVGMSRRIARAETPREALQASIVELGCIDETRITELTGAPAAFTLEALESEGQIFLDPESLCWETSDAYLSGNVRHKLRAARAAGGRFARNAAALEAVIPEDLAPSEIGARVGSTWIPVSEYENFLNTVTDTTGNRVGFSGLVGTWTVSEDFRCRYSVAATQTYGTSRINAIELFQMALNQTLPTVTDPVPGNPSKRRVNQLETIAAREKQQTLKDAFVEWLWSDDARAARLVRLYNDGFNSVVQRKYDGSHLCLPGFSGCVDLHPHQKDVIWRVVSSGVNTLMAHVVGAGKTLAAICAGMELRRIGKATKPLYVTPNHMLAQFTNEFLRAYPSAKLLMATKDDLAGDSRREFLSRIATSDWDAVLCTQATFERIKMGERHMREYIEAEIEQITAAIRAESNDRGNRIVKELARAKKVWQVKLDNLAAAHRKDGILSFEDLGIDWLFVDEAHHYKNLWRHTKMNRIAGLPNSNSERAFDMLVKTRYVMAKHAGRAGVVFMTGTPVSNSMAELHAMQRFLQPLDLEAANLAHFDNWAGNFGESVNALELAPDGSGYRMQTRFARFINLPELMGLFRQVADIRTAEMLSLPVPNAKKESAVIQPSDKLRAYVQTLVARAEDIRNGAVTPEEDNMLSVTGDGRKAALDMRLVDPSAVDEADGKIAACAANIARIWRDSAAGRGTQVVFCDLSTPRNDGTFSAYNDLRSKLIAHGIPADEIAFIHDYDSDASKEGLFAAVREGTVRVVMGSTAKMGVGTNIQTRLVALHHLDAPWRPADVMQREGRIVRQGNRNDNVLIYRYVTEASFDAYVWQTLESKARFVSQVMQGDDAIRNAEDVELAALSYAEVKALASGNPLVLEKAAVDTELAKLSILKTQWGQQQWRNKQELACMPAALDRAEIRIANLTNDHADWLASNSKQARINGVDCPDEGALGAAIAKAVRGQRFIGNQLSIGKIGNLDILVEFLSAGKSYSLGGCAKHQIGMLASSSSAAQAILEAANAIPARIQEAKESLARTLSRRDDLIAESAKPFEKESRLVALRQRQREIEDLLDLTKGDAGATDEDYKEAA